MTRERTLAFILIVLTTLAISLCFLLARPFLPALAWALSLAVVSYPLHRAIVRKMKSRDAGAVLTCAIVAVAVVAPALLVAQRIGREAVDAVQMVRHEAAGDRWRQNDGKQARACAAAHMDRGEDRRQERSRGGGESERRAHSPAS